MVTTKIIPSTLDKLRSTKLKFKGETKEMDVYRIPIDLLFFNDRNGRIATYIAKYNAENPNTPITSLPKKEYNNTIAEYIKQSGTKENFENTKESIRTGTQRERGVILDDGRVIDGNRRFTCLRDLYSETGDDQFAFFEAVILPAPAEEDKQGWKYINSLELEIQIGEDEKVPYNPIDWLVKIHRDLVEEQLYTIMEYHKITNIKENDIKKMIEKAKLMVDFLNFFDRSGEFHFAKSLELDGPLSELSNVRKKYSAEEWDEIKTPLYVFMHQKPKGDTSRQIRKLMKNTTTSDYKELVELANDAANEILSGDGDFTHTDGKTENFVKKAKDAIAVIDLGDARDKPINLCDSILKSISQIDMDIVNSWGNTEKRQRFDALIEEIKDKIGAIN